MWLNILNNRITRKVFMEFGLLKEIERKMPSFSKGQKAIANYIYEHYEKAAYMTASKLGEMANVSESTVVRFANELGFDGYPELQDALRNLTKVKLKSFQRMEVTNNLFGEGDIINTRLLADAENIKQTLEKIDRQAFSDAVDKIVTARNIYIMGVRSSSMLAGFLNFSFRMIFDNIKFVQTTSSSEMFEQIMHVNEDDVMIAISFPRYSKTLVNAVNYAKQNCADIVALTDSSASPIARQADQLLLARSDMASFVDSLVAPLSIINALVVAVAQKKQDEVTERLKELENIWSEYEVYDTKQ